MVVAVLSKAGDHVPVIPLFDVVGNALKLSPEQIALTAVKLGVMFGLTVMVALPSGPQQPAADCALK